MNFKIKFEYSKPRFITPQAYKYLVNTEPLFQIEYQESLDRSVSQLMDSKLGKLSKDVVKMIAHHLIEPISISYFEWLITTCRKYVFSDETKTSIIVDENLRELLDIKEETIGPSQVIELGKKHFLNFDESKECVDVDAINKKYCPD